MIHKENKMLDLTDLNLTTDIAGKVENTNLAPSHFLMPLFEAIVNSIHAIYDKKQGIGCVSITVYREKLLPNITDDKRDVPTIVGFDIQDNGIGFNDENLKSFMTSDSRYKKQRGGKGLGRFLWLKAFGEVHIKSIFQENNAFYCREFDFVPQGTGIKNQKQTELKGKQESCTLIQLRKMATKYSKNSCKTSAIANQIAKHLFSEILLENCPNITLKDELDEQEIVINKLMSQKLIVNSREDNLDIKGTSFKIRHILLKDGNKNEKHSVNFCADNRVVRSRELSLPNLDKSIQINNEQIVYKAFVSSDFLNKHTNNERTDFHILKEFEASEDELTWANIDPTIDKQAQTYLAPYLNETEKTRTQLLENYLQNDGMEFAPLRDELDLSSIDIQTVRNPNELDMALYKKRQKLEQQARKKGKELLAAVPEENQEEYNKQLEELFKSCDRLNSSALTKYVCGRKVILEILSKLLEKRETGKYSLEKAIHNLIYAMGKDSNTLNSGHNLWIIDETLPFNNYVSSDKKFQSMDSRVAVDQSMEPDLAVFHDLYAYSEDFPNGGAITFIEFKRPDRDDYTLTDNPIQQILDQAKQVKEGKAKSDRGILYQTTSRFYGYVICTITNSLRQIINERSELFPLPNEEGFYGFFRNQNLYMEIIDYQTLLKNAKKRNQVFFDKLQLPH